MSEQLHNQKLTEVAVAGLDECLKFFKKSGGKRDYEGAGLGAKIAATHARYYASRTNRVAAKLAIAKAAGASSDEIRPLMAEIQAL